MEGIMSITTPEIETHLAALYAAPERHYHGWRHILHMRSLAALHAEFITHHDAVLAMIDFHDAIYDSRRTDNEQQSADLARTMLCGRVPDDVLDKICIGIMATARHTIPDDLPVTWQRDIAFLLDADLAILGADEETFDDFDSNVRKEYAWVDDAAWRSGRSAVLRSFLERPQIYLTRPFQNLYEARARQNLQRLLQNLALKSGG